MDKKQLEHMTEPSVMEKFSEIQKQVDPLYKVRNSLDILGIASQHEHLNSASNIGEIGRKVLQQASLNSTSFESQSAIARSAQLKLPDTTAFNFEESNSLLKMASQHELSNSAVNIAGVANKVAQQLSLASSNVLGQSVIARQAQLRIPEAIAFKDTLLEMKKGLSAYNSIMSARERMIHSIGGNSVYENIMESVNLVRDSLEPYKSAFDIARTSFEANEISKLVRDIQSQKAITNSVLSDYAGVLKQVESIHNLESFKAITRLKNFPFEDMVRIDLDSIPDLEENISETIVELDSEISDELSLVDDFNELSEERRTVLLDLYENYYYPVILIYLVIGIWWKFFLNEGLDLSNNIFIYFESTKGILSYLDNSFYRPNPSGITDSIVAGYIFMQLTEFKENSKAVGIKKAIKMIFDSSNSVINRSMLKGCRVITEDSTYLRERHHIDAIGIESLSKGTIVREIKKEGKSWLLVEVLFNTEIGEGWVLRSETTTFK